MVGYSAAAAAASAAGSGRAAGGAGGAAGGPLADLDYVIGSAALSPAYAVSYPMKQGLIADWDAMEKLWAASFYQ